MEKDKFWIEYEPTWRDRLNGRAPMMKRVAALEADNRQHLNRVRELESRRKPAEDSRYSFGNRKLTGQVNYPADIITSQKLARRDPVAIWLLSTVVNVGFGDGLQIDTESEKIKKIWDEWWTHPDNRLDKIHKPLFSQYLRDGALLLPRAVQNETALVRFSALYVTDVQAVEPDPVNSLIRDTVLVQEIDDKGTEKEVEWAIVRVIGDEVRAKDHVAFMERNGRANELGDLGQQIDTKLNHIGKRVGDVYYFGHSPDAVQGNEALRGVPALYSIFDLLDDQQGQSGFVSMLYARLQLQVAALNYAGKYHVEGDEQRAEMLQTAYESGEFAIGGGAMTFFPKGEDVDFAAPSLNASDADSDIANFIRALCLPFGLPPFWAGFTQDVNRALSERASDPAILHLKAFRAEGIGIFQEMFEDQLDQKQAAGELSQDERDEGYEIKGREIETSDLPEIAQAFDTTMRALGADFFGDIPEQTRREMIARMVANYGVDMDMSEPAGPTAREEQDRVLVETVMEAKE